MGIHSIASQKRRISVVFRYDDFNSESSITLERSILELFGKSGIPLTIGVTPFVTAGDVEDPTPTGTLPLDSQKIELLRFAVRSVGAEIALHGHSHQTVSEFSENGYSEFVGIPLDTQRTKIERGKAYLESVVGSPVQTLIPPWNSYDADTLKAVADAGITALSADLDGLSPVTSTVSFAPATCTLGAFRRSIFCARWSNDLDPVIVVLFHPFDFDESLTPLNRSLGKLSDLLRWVESQNDISTVTVMGLCKSCRCMNAERLLKNQERSRRGRKRALSFHSICPQVYRSTEGSSSPRYLAILCIGVLAAGSLLTLYWTRFEESYGVFLIIVTVGILYVAATRLVGRLVPPRRAPG